MKHLYLSLFALTQSISLLSMTGVEADRSQINLDFMKQGQTKNTKQHSPIPTTPSSSLATQPTAIPSQEIEEKMQKKNPYSFSIGGNYSYVHIETGHQSSLHGNLGGMQTQFEYRPIQGIYEGIKASWKQGQLDSSSSCSRFLVDVNAEARLGFSVNSSKEKWIWTFFSGFGYQYLGHHMQKCPDCHLRFNYNEFYCPVGLFSDYSFTPQVSFGIHATWMPQVFPTVTIIPLKGARWGTQNTLANILIEAPLTFFAGKNNHFFFTIKPLFQYWQDGKSTAKLTNGDSLGVSGNTYLFWGADLNLGYAF